MGWRHTTRYAKKCGFALWGATLHTRSAANFLNISFLTLTRRNYIKFGLDPLLFAVDMARKILVKHAKVITSRCSASS